MQKSYSLKLYSLAGTFLSTVSPSLIMDKPSFSSTTEGGQGEVRMKLAVGGDYTAITYGTIARITCYSDFIPGGRVIYSGYVTRIIRTFAKTEYIELTIVGIASLLTFVQYPNGSYTGDPATLAKAVIDHFSTVYPWLISYTPSSVINAGTSVTVKADFQNSFDVLKNIIGTTKNFWNVDANGVFNFRPADNYGSHILTLAREVETLTIEENSEEIANSVTIYGSYGSWSAQDAVSIAANGKRSRSVQNEGLGNVWSATVQAQAEVDRLKNPKKRISAVINNLYDIELMTPGDRVTIRNSKTPIEALQIRRIDYNEKQAKIDLEETRSFALEVSSI